MTVQVAIASDFLPEFPVARTVRSRKPVEESFGQRLARLRKARGYTQTELGEFLDLSQRMMTYYEREEGRPPAHLLGQMAEALGVSVEELLGLKPVADKPAPRNNGIGAPARAATIAVQGPCDAGLERTLGGRVRLARAG